MAPKNKTTSAEKKPAPQRKTRRGRAEHKKKPFGKDGTMALTNKKKESRRPGQKKYIKNKDLIGK